MREFKKSSSREKGMNEGSRSRSLKASSTPAMSVVEEADGGGIGAPVSGMTLGPTM